ncbi:VanW family protein [Bacillus cereus]|uniref:VanW family protein n=1 Tax=Bacillus cereus TaxID=1396 RepID=UPI0018F58F54|nr:VanW family protein [Bacillus cereus]MBJ8026009.1 VanW family protein [Bacillus cereus]MBJ8038292.1 VanW family protein [Bacillus cereus]
MPNKSDTLLMRKQIKRTKCLIFICIILLIILISFKMINYISSLNETLKEVVLPHTKIEEREIGGLNKNQLASVSHEQINGLMQKKLVFLAGDSKQNYTYQDIGIEYEPNQVINQIFNQQNGDKWANLLRELAAKIGLRNAQYKFEPTINEEKLKQFVIKEFGKFQIEPINASIKGNDNLSTVSYQNEKYGKKVDINMLKKDILNTIHEKQNKINLKYVNIPPSVSIQDLKKINLEHAISEYKTSLIGRNENVLENIKKAANTLNGAIISPEKEFSFNETVGITDQAHGYKNASVILHNKTVQAAGGGVCQVSTTLYNAVLLANLDILSRTNHSRQVSYVPTGLDATVADYGPDFKFKNTSNTPVYIKTTVANNQLTIQLFGKNNDDIINIYTETVKQTNSLFKVNTYREVKNKNGLVIKREFISTSTYKTN